jgi:uncharacterized membrane protein YfcA
MASASRKPTELSVGLFLSPAGRFMSLHDFVLTCLFAFMALLYSSVGHAGSSGYQAAMALLGVGQEIMKPTALSLNIFVAAIALVQFVRRGCFNLRLFLWLALPSIPMAWVGGKLQLPAGWYNWLVALILWVAAFRLWMRQLPHGGVEKALSYPLILLVGALLGLLSGMTGTGGGIFLTPFLVLMGWTTPRIAAGISAAIILVNSAAGIMGWWETHRDFVWPELLPLWMGVVAVCGLVGSYFGSRYGSPLLLRRLLALVLVIAGLKMVLLK